MPVFVFVFIWRRRVSVIERVGYIWSHQAAHTQGGQLGFRCWFGCHGAHADDIWYFFFGYCFFVAVFSISIFLGSTFNLIFRGNFLCHKILGQIFISIFWGRFFYSIFWGNFFGSQYSGATFCVIRYWGNFVSQFSGADFLIQYFGATSLGLNILGQLFANILTADWTGWAACWAICKIQRRSETTFPRLPNTSFLVSDQESGSRIRIKD